MFSNKDLRNLLIPLLWEQLLAVTIGVMDTVMVARCGESAVSGVSLVDSINVLLIQVFSALATGGAVITSQYLGKKDARHANESAKQLYYVVLAASCSMMAVCLFFRRSLLNTLFGSIEPEVMKAALIYFLLTALSFPFIAVYNASAALLRSMGRSSATFRTSVAMNLINVCGNALTIYGFGMGVAGAGLATLLSRMIGSIYIQHFLSPAHSVISAPRLWPLNPDPALIRKILAVGLPNGFENGLFQFGKLMLVRMIATFGTVSIAANAVGNTIATFQCIPGAAISLGMITVVGQCVGAHEFGQARAYTHRLMRLVYLIMGTLNLVMLALIPVLLLPFSLSPETSALASRLILIHGIGAVLLWPLSFVLPNALRAAGDARFTMLVSTFSMLCFRVALGYVLGIPAGLGVVGVWLAMEIDWCFRIVLFVWRFHGHQWETKALV